MVPFEVVTQGFTTPMFAICGGMAFAGGAGKNVRPPGKTRVTSQWPIVIDFVPWFVIE